MRDGSPVASPPPSSLGKRSSLQITAASLLGAASGYVVLAVVARSVSLTDNALFVTFWAALLTMYGILTGVNTETARSVAAARMSASPGTRRTTSHGTVAQMAAVVAGLVLIVGLLLWRFGLHVFPSSRGELAVIVTVSAGAYAVQAVILGSLSGRASWSSYAGLLGLEAGIRVVLVALVATLAGSVAGVAAAAAAAAAAWVVMLAISLRARDGLRARLDAPLMAHLARSAVAAVAAGASAVLLVGFPVLVSITTPQAIVDTAAPLMLAVTLTRAPIMVPLTAFQSVIVAQFVSNIDRAGRMLTRAVAALGAVGTAGAIAAYAIGPEIMVLLFGAEYRVGGGILAAMTIASVGTAVITVTAALTQAMRRRVGFVVGWLVALGVTGLVMFSGASLETRLIWALLAAPYCGVVVHLVVIRRALREAADGARATCASAE